eukprot:3320749-Ditylum_brightwellii.AAC.1
MKYIYLGGDNRSAPSVSVKARTLVVHALNKCLFAPAEKLPEMESKRFRQLLCRLSRTHQNLYEVPTLSRTLSPPLAHKRESGGRPEHISNFIPERSEFHKEVVSWL